jgi:tRNA A-37 threonylcarbamoyl transferase component Bud32
MGQVWLAEHRALDIQVAVKFMRRDVADDPVSVARFEQEAKLAARIKSPHVVEVFDFDVTDTGVPFIVMESLKGRDLETVLQNGRTLGISDTARVLVHVCKALSKAHALGIIHRDVKAENVFVCQDEGVPLIKVLDFGVAKETASAHGISLSGTTVGTPSYMSPEQLFHPKEIDLRTDLWATAVLVYRCLTGTFPFEGESFASVCLSVSKGKFTTPSAVNSVLPGGLDAWFKKAFNKNLSARFSSAAEMSEAFLNELRKEDLLPAWVETNAVASSAVATQVSPGRSRRAPRRRHTVRRAVILPVAAAVAALSFFEFAPPPARAMVTNLAGQATEWTRTWAVNEGFYPPSLASLGDGADAELGIHANEVRWRPPPALSALAERDVPRLDETGRVITARRDQVEGRVITLAAAPVPTSVEFDLSVPAGLDSTPTTDPAAVPAPTANASSTASTPNPAPTTTSTDLATIRFGL